VFWGAIVYFHTNTLLAAVFFAQKSERSAIEAVIARLPFISWFTVSRETSKAFAKSSWAIRPGSEPVPRMHENGAPPVKSERTFCFCANQ
jgi:hypothetical protein